jgi:DNA polymerase-3 subunit epsilon
LREPGPWDIGAAPVTVVRPARPHAPSEAELARHAAFLAQIKDPIWNRV